MSRSTAPTPGGAPPPSSRRGSPSPRSAATPARPAGPPRLLAGVPGVVARQPERVHRGADRARPPSRRLQQRRGGGDHRRDARAGRGGPAAAAAARHRWSPTSTACSATSTPSSCTTCGSRSAAPVRPIKLLGEVLPGRPGGALQGRVQVAGRRDHADPGPGRAPARLRRDGRAARVPRPRPTWSRSAPSWPGAAPASSGGWPRRCAGRGSAPSPTTGARRCWRSATPAPAQAPPRPPRRAGAVHHRARVPPDRRAGRRDHPDSPPESLHDLRKRAKELRYLLEFFAPLHDPVAYRKVVGDLKQLQDCLGEFQDSEVQREEIHALADAMLAERAAPAATLLAMGEIAAKLALSQAEAREDFAAGSPGSRARRARSGSASCSRAAREDLRHLQHQGRRRQDDRRRQPGLPVRRRRPPHPALGPGPAGRGQLPVPDQAPGQGRREGAHPRHQGPGRRDQGHRLRRPGPDPRRLHLPQHGPAPGRARTRSRPAGSPSCSGRWPPSTTTCSSTARRASRWSRRTSCTPPTCCWSRSSRPRCRCARWTSSPSSWPASTAAAREVRAFFSMVDRRKKLHREIIKDLQAERATSPPPPSRSVPDRAHVRGACPGHRLRPPQRRRPRLPRPLDRDSARITSVAALPGRDAGLVALGVGQHPEAGASASLSELAARRHRGLDALVRLVVRHGDVEVEPVRCGRARPSAGTRSPAPARAGPPGRPAGPTGPARRRSRAPPSRTA